MLSTNMSHVSACDAYRGPEEHETLETYVDRLAGELDAEFQRVGPDKVRAFVAEPVVGAVSFSHYLMTYWDLTSNTKQALGCVPSVLGYFKSMKTICDKYGALLILDEVMCGMGRTGTMHAWEQEGVIPDIEPHHPSPSPTALSSPSPPSHTYVYPHLPHASPSPKDLTGPAQPVQQTRLPSPTLIVVPQSLYSPSLIKPHSRASSRGTVSHVAPNTSR